MSGVGIILSGGGARGAYEVGVLSYLFGDFVLHTGRVPRIDVISGCSVGAVNGTFLASVAHEPVAGIERLVAMWYGLEFSQVLSFGLREIAFLHRVWLGGAKPQGLFDAEPLARLIGTQISWLSLARNLRRGMLGALTVATTHVATGKPHVFVDLGPHRAGPDNVGRHVVLRKGPVRAQHVLASAAIPLVFPMVEVDGELHCDGGLRANTPTAPAIHLGADKLFVVGLSCRDSNRDRPALAPDRAPGAPFLFGKVLDAFFLDHLDMDLREIERVNEYMQIGQEAFGSDFGERLNAASALRGGPQRHTVRCALVRPSVDLGRIAHDYMGQPNAKRGPDSAMATMLLRAVDVGEASEADLASFLLFDSGYSQILVELGRHDAAAQRDELAEFFFG